MVEHSPLILEVRGSILTPSVMLGYFLSMLCSLMYTIQQLCKIDWFECVECWTEYGLISG